MQVQLQVPFPIETPAEGYESVFFKREAGAPANFAGVRSVYAAANQHNQAVTQQL